MRKLILSITFLSISVLCTAQKDMGFSVEFKYATDIKNCTEVNAYFCYYPRQKSFTLDSKEADSISRYGVLGYNEKDEDVKIYTTGGMYSFRKNSKGQFISCTFINSDLTMKIVYGDLVLHPLKQDLVLKN